VQERSLTQILIWLATSLAYPSGEEGGNYFYLSSLHAEEGGEAIRAL
jgi:hypothetical protein